MADAGAMKLAERGLGRAEIGEVALRLCDVQRHSVDEAAHKQVPPGIEQLR